MEALVTFRHRCDGQNGVCAQELNRAMRFLFSAGGFVLFRMSTRTLGVGVASTRMLKAMMTIMYGKARAVPANGAFFALVAFLLLAVAAAVTLFVLAVRRGFWMDKKHFLALLGMLVLGAAVGVTYWTFISTGYVDTPVEGLGPVVPMFTVDILGRVTSLLFLLLLSLLTWLLLSAVVATVFPEQKKLSLAVALVLVAIALGTTAYSVSMIVPRGVPVVAHNRRLRTADSRSFLSVQRGSDGNVGSGLVAGSDKAKGRSRIRRNETQRGCVLCRVGTVDSVLHVVVHRGVAGAVSRL